MRLLRIRLVKLAGFLGAIALACLVVRWTLGTSLTDRARLVLSDLPTDGSPLHYGWLSGSRLRACWSDINGNHETFLDDYDVEDRTHSRRKLEPPAGAWGYPNELSPDGKWLVWGGPDTTEREDTRYVVFQNLVFQNVESDELFRTSRAIYADYAWSPDRHICGLVSGVKKDGDWDVHLGTIDLQTHREWRSRRVSPAELICALTSSHTLITCVRNPFRAIGGESMYRVEAKGSGWHSLFGPEPPLDESLNPVESSPDGSRLVWLSTRPIKQEAGFFHRLLSFIHIKEDEDKDSSWHRLLVSDSNGERMRELGRIKIDSGYVGSIDSPHWLPDGRSISFLVQGKLYVIGAD